MENEKMVTLLSELNAGDHVVVAFNPNEFFHAIFVRTMSEGLEIIFFNSEKLPVRVQERISESLYELRHDIVGKYQVHKVRLFYDEKKFRVYVVKYEQQCLPAFETVKRAEKLVGEGKYNAFENNDEHFASYCKTGKSGKLLLVDTSKIDTKEIFGASVGERVTSTLKSTGRNLVLVNIAQSLATSFPRNAVASALPTILKNTTPLVGIGLESYAIGSDINEKYKETKEGKISDIKFRKFVAKRVTRSTVSMAGGFGGAVAGQMLIPVPLVGAMVGGLVGGMLGSAAGWAQSILVGEVVETVDKKICKLIDNNQHHQHVLDHLVLKFDDSVSTYLNKDNLQIQIEEEMNQDDYEIYVIDQEKENPSQNEP